MTDEQIAERAMKNLHAELMSAAVRNVGIEASRLAREDTAAKLKLAVEALRDIAQPTTGRTREAYIKQCAREALAEIEGP